MSRNHDRNEDSDNSCAYNSEKECNYCKSNCKYNPRRESDEERDYWEWKMSQ